MRVLHVVAPGVIGGLERVVLQLAQGQDRAGTAVHVAAVVSPGGDIPLLEALAGGGVTTHPIAIPGRAYRQEWTAMKHLYRRLRPDVVHTHGYRPDVIAAAPARSEGIPRVTTVHGFTGGDWKNRLYERLQRRAYRKFDAVVAVSRPLADQLIRQRVPAERIHVVQNAWQETTPPFDRVTARRVLGVPEDGFRIGYVGRLSAEKGPDVLVDALALLTDLPLSVSIIGTGTPSEQESLRERARERGVERLIQWHGLVPDAARLYAAFDAWVLSSRTEGTPIVLFEAMAARVPIIATRVGGVPDVVSPAEAALVAPDDPPALAGAIRAVYVDPGAARVRAEQAHTRVLRDFTVPPWIQRYEGIYELVCTRSPEAVATP